MNGLHLRRSSRRRLRQAVGCRHHRVTHQRPQSNVQPRRPFVGRQYHQFKNRIQSGPARKHQSSTRRYLKWVVVGGQPRSCTKEMNQGHGHQHRLNIHQHRLVFHQLALCIRRHHLCRYEMNQVHARQHHQNYSPSSPKYSRVSEVTSIFSHITTRRTKSLTFTVAYIT